MRIAVIGPAREDDSMAKKAAELADALAALGHEATLFGAGQVEKAAAAPTCCECNKEPGLDVAACGLFHLSAAFERADDFDIIHAMGGMAALPFTKMTTTPVVVEAHAPLQGASLEFFKKHNGIACYVSADDSSRVPGLEYAGSAASPEEFVRVYEKIIEQRKREDHRPWGYYVIYADTPTHKVKRIVVYPGKRLSLQRHHRRSEHWYVIQGKAVVTLNEREVPLEAGMAVDIPVETWHRMMNPGDENMAFIEVQTGDYFGEDDIDRAQDDYGRVS